MGKKRYKQRKNITVRPCDNPREYARQYYWVTVKGKKSAPKKRGKKRK